MIDIAIQTGLPVLLWGEPGVGKSAYIRAVARGLGLPLEVVIASFRQPTDFCGLPVISKGTVKYAPPVWAERLAQAGQGLLFLDEINTAPPAVQATLMRVVLDRQVGDDFRLPDDILIVAAANPVDISAGGWELAPPLANRFVHFTWDPSPASIAAGFLNGWQDQPVTSLPDGWKDSIPAKRREVGEFLVFRPELAKTKVNPDSVDSGRAYPSARTWDYSATMLAAAESVAASEEDIYMLVSGCVGPGAAAEFLAWRREHRETSPRQLLDDPEGAKLPDRPDKLHALVEACISEVENNQAPADWQAAWKIIVRLSRQGYGDLAVTSGQRLAQVPMPEGAQIPYEVSELWEVLSGGM